MPAHHREKRIGPRFPHVLAVLAVLAIDQADTILSARQVEHYSGPQL